MQEKIENCNHDETIDELMPEGCIHYSKKVCIKCNKFLRWNPNPETIKQFNERVTIIQTLMGITGLSEFEKSFLRNIKTCKHLTPKQNDVWVKICKKYDNNLKN